MKIGPVGAEFYADVRRGRRREMAKLIVAFLDIFEGPLKWLVHIFACNKRNRRKC
jgi:hypothetical protein